MPLQEPRLGILSLNTLDCNGRGSHLLRDWLGVWLGGILQARPEFSDLVFVADQIDIAVLGTTLLALRSVTKVMPTMFSVC